VSSRVRRIWLILAIVAAGGLAIGAGTLVAIRLLRRERPGLEETIRQVDEELSKGRFLPAGELLKSGFREARGEAGYLRLLKRELQIAEMSGSYRQFARRALEAAKNLPGSGSLAVLAVYGALRSEHPEDAAAAVARAPRHRELEALKVEAHLRGLLPGGVMPRPEGRLGTLAELPGLQDPAAMHTLAGLLEEPRLDLDAALLWAGAGRFDEAFAVLWPHRGLPEVGEALLFLAFDAGRFREAWELQGADPALRGLPEQMVFRGDLAWLLGMPERAAEQYQRAIESDPGYSWAAYLNLAGLMSGLGDQAGARLFRRKAFDRFPGQAQVVLAHARDLAEQGATARAREILAALIEQEPDHLEARLLALELEGARGSPALYQGRMWELLNGHPGDPELTRSFSLYLLGLRDTRGAAAVLGEYERVHGEPFPPWYLELRGIVALAQGDPERAAGFLRESLAGEPDWRRRYNLALVLMAGQHYEQALGELIQSETDLASAEDRVGPPGLEALRSRVRSRIAEAQTGLGNYEAARREALYALDLDAANHQARRVLRILEGLQ